MKSMLVIDVLGSLRRHQNRPEPTHQDGLCFSLPSIFGTEDIDRAIELVRLGKFLPGQPGNGAGDKDLRHTIDELQARCGFNSASLKVATAS